MFCRKWFLPALAGFCAGGVTGLFGAGGGMILVPLLAMIPHLDEDSIFPVSVSVILPGCIVGLSNMPRRSHYLSTQRFLICWAAAAAVFWPVSLEESSLFCGCTGFWAH